MNKFLKNPKHLVLIALSLLFLAGMPRLGTLSLVLLITCLFFTVGSDILFTYIRRKKFFLSRSAIITGLILTLVVDPHATWYQILVIGASSMAIKNFLRVGNRHIFNPAASGLLVGWILFQLFPSWWAPSLYSENLFTLSNIGILISILLVAYISCFRLKRYATVGMYLLVSFLLLQVSTMSLSIGNTLMTILSPGTLFYAFVMLAEPMTSPVQKKRQMLYGGFVAVIGFVLVTLGSMTGYILFDASLVAILLGNLLFFKFR